MRAYGLLLVVSLGMAVGCGERAGNAGKRISDSDWQRMKDCSAQADRKFLAMGYGKDDKSGDLAAYECHYDPQSQRCFFYLETTTWVKGGTGQSFTSKLLTDAFEGKTYAEFSKIWSTDKPLRGPATCNWLSEAGEKVSCKTSEEFDARIEQYLGKVKAAK